MYKNIKKSVLFLLYSIVYTFGIPQKALPFPHLTDFKLTDIGKPVHVFEGIDYDTLPDDLKNEYTDCYAEHYKCIRSRTQHSPVCGYDITKIWDLHKRWFREYMSHCDLNLHNCNAMVKTVRGMYGHSIKDGLIFFMGEGYVCEIYARTINRTMVDFTQDD